MQFERFDLTQPGAIMTLNSRSLLLGMGNYQWKTAQELDPQQPAFYYPDFFLRKSSPWLQFEQSYEISIDQLNLVGSSLHLEPTLQWQMPHQMIFHEEFNALKRTFASSSLQKAVPYIFAYCQGLMTSERLHITLMQALHSLQQGYGYLYGFWTFEEGVLGLTPELLFSYHQEPFPKIKTVALAGTGHKHEGAMALKQNPKELREHELVVKGIKESLQPLGKVAVQELQVLELPLLNHLMTPIDVALFRSLRFEEIVAYLHPTPALGAFPRQEGQIWLEQYQKKIARGYYGAPVGIWDMQRQMYQCYVAIRNVQWDRQGMRIGAGCGIIHESQWEREWSEIKLKVQAIRQALRL